MEIIHGFPAGTFTNMQENIQNPNISYASVKNAVMEITLQQELCPGCGEIKPDGLWAILSHDCPLNKHTYCGFSSGPTLLTGSNGMRMFKRAIESFYGSYKDPFEGLLIFKSFQPMPNFETATWLDKNCYRLQRESDIRTMKRLRAYMELENALIEKW